MILSKEKDAVLQFKNSCIKQGKALESGDYKEGNKSAKYIYESIEFLKARKREFAYLVCKSIDTLL